MPLTHTGIQEPFPHLAGTEVVQEEPPGWDPQGVRGSECQIAPD